MNKPPAFQFYPKDFISDINVSVMNMEERGIYITLLSYCWLEGWLPNASSKLKRMCNNPSNWKESWKNVKPCFYKNGNKLYHKRLEKERKKQEEWREKSRLGGKKSGEERRKKDKKKGGSTTLKPPYKPKVNQRPTLQFSSSTSSSNYKKKNINKKKKPKKQKDALRDDFIKEQAEKIISYFNEKTGKRFSPKTKDTLKKIKVLFIEHNRRVEDFRKVIDIKVSHWKAGKFNDEHMSPETLFKEEKFDKYWNQEMEKTKEEEFKEKINKGLK